MYLWGFRLVFCHLHSLLSAQKCPFLPFNCGIDRFLVTQTVIVDFEGYMCQFELVQVPENGLFPEVSEDNFGTSEPLHWICTEQDQSVPEIEHPVLEFSLPLVFCDHY
jgi:hypothetical protein